MKTPFVSILVMLFLFFQTTQAQLKDASCSEQTAKIMILGMYHMDNPGQDTYNLEADNVLSAKRQKEIAEVVEKLAGFKPTKIALESAYRNTYWTSRYEKYLTGEYKLEKNEIEQIGFQLAKKLNHKTLYPVDFPMWMNGLMPNEREEPKVTPSPSPTPQSTPQPAKREMPLHVAKLENLVKTGTVKDVLMYLNNLEYEKIDHAIYMSMLMPSETIAIYDKTDLVTNWYKRNLRIFTNINRVTEFPNDRILLIIGSGHLKILKDFAIDSPQFCLVEANDYLK